MLKNNNIRLTSALQESTANVDQWKRQLQSFKEENQRLKQKYIELEASKGGMLLLLLSSCLLLIRTMVINSNHYDYDFFTSVQFTNMKPTGLLNSI